MDSDTPTIDALSERDDRLKPHDDALAKRVAHLRKAYARGLGHRPSTLQSAAIDRCARLAALSEQALADPNVSNTDRVRLNGAYRRAKLDMDQLLQIGVPKPRTFPSLAELNARSAAQVRR